MLGSTNECFSDFFLVVINGILFPWLIPESHPHLERGQSRATAICHHFSTALGAFHVFLTSAVNSPESFVCWSGWLLGSLHPSLSLSLSLVPSFSCLFSSISLPRALLTYFSLVCSHTYTHTHTNAHT